ncbi:MAG: helix-turn-helix transcriptional regulator [Hyphomonas sp.]|uniref:ArsR/SmtB family transcription factor n=1 Tax=Hyphomonas sp. TaxID=87 RepID=UPI001832917C|nr:metalloregulator ArsR/SmtB family transcription factor [Hyphomonas sp.]MBA3067778.1 helix-turn-helix transcriptional regulator [Hyphomonas sp.]MBU3920901.1 metalloregulator ArsR/SmtB family transcription factor [Alphaproteobacteria bacterium]MBU4062134.1 metalloregulator ArsR/SmtB family transcription factor [Alphaproteobacteria bacterium]MBU4165569.1 metalloregulator ArsR/SmtB family transcription factor [Alphaproteobacteria bacterium]
MESTRTIEQLSALAHAGRLSVFRLLVRAAPGGLPAGDIARQVGIPPNTLSAQLTILNHAGLVHHRREGRSIIHSADTGAMSALILYLMDDCCSGRPEICGPVLKAAHDAACC